MRVRTEQEIAARELMKAAYHEISHAAVCEHFGVYATASIWKNRDHLEHNESAWSGQCQMVDLHQVLTTEQRRLIGLAGFVGEEMARAKLDGDLETECVMDIAETFFSALEDGYISETDIMSIGEDVSDAHVHAATQILLQHWAEVDLRAKKIIEEAMQSPSRMSCFYSSSKDQSMTEFFGIPTRQCDAEEINDFFAGK